MGEDVLSVLHKFKGIINSRVYVFVWKFIFYFIQFAPSLSLSHSLLTTQRILYVFLILGHFLFHFFVNAHRLWYRFFFGASGEKKFLHAIFCELKNLLKIKVRILAIILFHLNYLNVKISNLRWQELFAK